MGGQQYLQQLYGRAGGESNGILITEKPFIAIQPYDPSNNSGLETERASKAARAGGSGGLSYHRTRHWEVLGSCANELKFYCKFTWGALEFKGNFKCRSKGKATITSTLKQNQNADFNWKLPCLTNIGGFATIQAIDQSM